MSNYIAPIEDIRFVLTYVAGLEQVLDLPTAAPVDIETVEAILAEGARFAEGVLAPLNTVGDREGAVFKDGAVKMPTGFREAYALYVDAGWGGLGAPTKYGGQALPHIVTAAVGELWKAANLAFSANFLLTTGAVEAIAHHGSDEQKARFLPHLVSGKWCGVMNLTEPQAGSDLAAIRTRAVLQSDGSYRLYGQKCFITYAEHDMAENIVHLVLARLPDAPPGVKGISMFIVSQHEVMEDGSLSARNQVQVTGIEEKLGQHASPTCTVQHEGSKAELVGHEGQGLHYMFVMVNAARLGVSIEGLGIAERALQQAKEYAEGRVQGRLEGGSEAVAIARHPDVRRMLLTMQAQTEAMRCMSYVVASWLDCSERCEEEGWRTSHQSLVEFMIPVLKGWMTETGAEVADLGIQVHGGAGYIEETGAAQHLRDVRVTAIYEGTTGIQAAELVRRKLLRSPGPGALAELQRRMHQTLSELRDRVESHPELRPLAYELTMALDSLEVASSALLLAAQSKLDLALLSSVPYLRLLGTVSGGWQLCRAALAAIEAKDIDDTMTDFARTKLCTAQHYAMHVLPRVLALSHTVVRVCNSNQADLGSGADASSALASEAIA
jgi:alkylation response protein AidB-like acyl-CoA dehydrogenase